jgi:hypothetical protein
MAKKIELIHSFAPSDEHLNRCLAPWAAKFRVTLKLEKLPALGSHSDELCALV